MKMFALILLIFSNTIFADNAYRKIYFGKDYEEHRYLIITDDLETKIYSTDKLYTRHNAVPSIILNDLDFEKLLEEFKEEIL
jgi:hypothetical protein